MAKGRKTGGRKKGSKNKVSIDVAVKLEQLGCDPIEGMALIAQNVATPLDLKARMFAELAQYIAPKRKAVEHSGPDGAPLGTASWLPPLAK